MRNTTELLEASREGGDRIRQARYSLGMTQTELARAIGVGRSNVCRWEKGQNLPHPRWAQALASALGWEDFPAGYLGRCP